MLIRLPECGISAVKMKWTTLMPRAMSFTLDMTFSCQSTFAQKASQCDRERDMAGRLAAISAMQIEPKTDPKS